MRFAVIALVLITVGCGGSVGARDETDSYSADSFVACLRDDEGLLVPVDEVLDVRPGFTVDEPERGMSLRISDEKEPKIRGDFTMVRWYGIPELSGEDPELSKVQLYFAAAEDDAQALYDEHAENARRGGATEAALLRELERRRNVVLVWDKGGTDAMRTQIDRCLS